MEKSNDKALKIIERQYDSFINLSDQWDFFRGLADYVKTVQEMTLTKPYIEALETQRTIARQAFEMMNTEAMRELKKSAQKMQEVADEVAKHYAPMLKVVEEARKQAEPMLKAVEEARKQYEPIAHAVKEVQDQLNGKMWCSNPIFHLDKSLFDIARHVKSAGFADKIKEFEDPNKKTKNIYGDYTFSPTAEKISEEEKRLERLEQVEPWGAWHQLPLIRRFVYEPEKYIEECRAEAKENPDLTFTFYNFMGIAGEMEAIRSGKASQNDVVFFRVKDFRSFAQRFHNYITTELVKAETGQKLEYDSKQSTLYFVDESIKISKRADSDAHDLLRTIFKDKEKLWDNDEVLEDWKVAYDKKRIPKNKVYQAGKAVNRIIAQETKIKDFLEVTTKNVAINKKYLKT